MIEKIRQVVCKEYENTLGIVVYKSGQRFAPVKTGVEKYLFEPLGINDVPNANGVNQQLHNSLY